MSVLGLFFIVTQLLSCHPRVAFHVWDVHIRCPFTSGVTARGGFTLTHLKYYLCHFCFWIFSSLTVARFMLVYLCHMASSTTFFTRNTPLSINIYFNIFFASVDPLLTAMFLHDHDRCAIVIIAIASSNQPNMVVELTGQLTCCRSHGVGRTDTCLQCKCIFTRSSSLVKMKISPLRP